MATKEERTSFFSRFAPIAQEIEELFGIPASVTLSQAALETGYGTSGAATNYNSYFGVKKAGNAGTVPLLTKEWDGSKYVSQYASFGAYASPEDSFYAYGELIGESKIYEQARTSSTNPIEWLSNIKAAGYATDPDYVDKTANIIVANNLTQYDKYGSTGLPYLDQALKDRKTINKGKVSEDIVFKDRYYYTQEGIQELEATRKANELGWIGTTVKVIVIILLVIVVIVMVVKSIGSNTIKNTVGEAIKR